MKIILLVLLSTGVLFAETCGDIYRTAEADLEKASNTKDAELVTAYAARANAIFTKYQACLQKNEIKLLQRIEGKLSKVSLNSNTTAETYTSPAKSITNPTRFKTYR